MLLSDGTRVRLVSRLHSLDGQPLLIRLAHSEEPLFSRLKDLVLASLVVLPLVLVVAGIAGYGLARRALSPIEQMARRAQEITPEKLHARLPNDDTDDELGQLARVFNETLARLEQAFEQLRRFTSDASHELRTPLAAIRSVGEVGLQKDGTRAEYRDIVGSMLEEVNRLTSLDRQSPHDLARGFRSYSASPDSRAGDGAGSRGRRACSRFSWKRNRNAWFSKAMSTRKSKAIACFCGRRWSIYSTTP